MPQVCATESIETKYMVKPSRHISKFGKKELDHFFAVAKCAKKNQAFTILTAPAGKAFGRILIIASKKYGNAPQRNKLRRQLKAIFLQNHLYEYNHDVAIIARPHAKNYDFQQLSTLLCSIFTQH